MFLAYFGRDKPAVIVMREAIVKGLRYCASGTRPQIQLYGSLSKTSPSVSSKDYNPSICIAPRIRAVKDLVQDQMGERVLSFSRSL